MLDANAVRWSRLRRKKELLPSGIDLTFLVSENIGKKSVCSAAILEMCRPWRG